MPSEERKRSSRSNGERSGSGSGSGRSGRSSRGQTDTKTVGETIKDAKKQTAEAAAKAKQAAATAKEAVAPVLNGAVDALGGWDELDKTIRTYNPTLADYAENSLLGKLSVANSPAKFVLTLIALGIVQSVLPVIAWPVALLAQLLAFLFLYNTGIKALQGGFESSRSVPRVKTLLVTLLLSSLVQVIPPFLFDATYHLGALWGFFMPALMFVTPTKGKETIGEMICASVFAQVGDVLTSITPDIFQGQQGSQLLMIGGGILALLFWVGYLGASASYAVVWAFLTIQSISALGEDVVPSTDREGFKAQQTVWHNLLAIWLWRYLLSAVESVSIPGVVSVIGLILFYVPSWFLWSTAFMYAMIATPKTEDKRRANTWYARWLLGGFKATNTPAASSSGSSSTKQSSSKREGGSSGRSK